MTFIPEIRFKGKLRKMPLHEIVEAYKKGERNFTGIDGREFEFSNMDLRGADFSDSDLRFTAWRGTKLQGANLSGCDLEWSTFEHADLRGARFVGSNISKSVLNNATVDQQTDMTKADLSWSLLFNVNWGAIKREGAMTTTTAFTPGDVTEEGARYIQAEAGLLRHLSYETQMFIQFSLSNTRTAVQKLAIEEKGTSTVSYQSRSQGGSYASEAGVNAYEAVKGGGERKRKGGYDNL